LKLIDVIATFIQMRGTVYDLEEAEVCYAPQYGSAKDPVNLAGMIATNLLRGDAPVAHWEEIAHRRDILILDVRDPDEYAAGHINEAVNIPLPELRQRLHEIDPNQEIWVHCQVGHRAHYATRILRLHGYNAKNLSGGYTSYLSKEVAPLLMGSRT
jgi:rhodanese-related sulfurtransferase